MRTCRLYLKSSSQPEGSAHAGPAQKTPTQTPRTKAAEYVHVVSPSQTYQVRQVSTSNALYVVRPSPLGHGNNDGLNRNGAAEGEVNGEGDGEEGIDQGIINTAPSAITAISQVGTVLELQKVEYDVVAHLRRVLPVWGQGTIVGATGPDVKKKEVFDQIPAPDAWIEEAWRMLFVMELDENGQDEGDSPVFIPDTETLLEAWEDAMRGFVLGGGPRGMGNERVLEARDFLEDDEDAKRALSIGTRAAKRAIWRSPVLRGVGQGDGEIGEALEPLYQKATTKWVGELIMGSEGEKVVSENEGNSKGQRFLERLWQLLPESWADGVKFGEKGAGQSWGFVIEEEEGKLGGSMVTWRETDGGAAAGPEGTERPGAKGSQAKKSGQEAKGAAAAAPGLGKRKWHDKFKESRNIKR